MMISRSLLVGLLLSVLISQAFAATININTASAKQISTALKGVGPKKAEAIVQYRKAHGPFKSLHELQSVKGIGPKTAAANKALIRFSDKAGSGTGSSDSGSGGDTSS